MIKYIFAALTIFLSSAAVSAKPLDFVVPPVCSLNEVIDTMISQGFEIVEILEGNEAIGFLAGERTEQLNPLMGKGIINRVVQVWMGQRPDGSSLTRYLVFGTVASQPDGMCLYFYSNIEDDNGEGSL